MRDQHKYDWWEHDAPQVRTHVPRGPRGPRVPRVPRDRGPAMGIALVVIVGVAFWTGIYLWLH